MNEIVSLKYITTRNDGLYLTISEEGTELKVVFQNNSGEIVHTVVCQREKLFEVLDNHQDW